MPLFLKQLGFHSFWAFENQVTLRR